MARVNDVGGMEGFGPLDLDEHPPGFGADWEARVFAMNRALIGRGLYTLDEFRDALERMPPSEYLAASYYEKWLAAITTLVTERGLVDAAELAEPIEQGGPSGPAGPA